MFIGVAGSEIYYIMFMRIAENSYDQRFFPLDYLFIYLFIFKRVDLMAIRML